MDLSYYTVGVGGTLLDAAQAIAKNRSRCVVVVDHGKAIGVFSEGDLVRALLRGTDLHSPMQPFIHHGFHFLEQRDPVRALELFRAHGISLIPITSSTLELQSVITLSEILDQVILNPSVPSE